MSKESKNTPPKKAQNTYPAWYDGKNINEYRFCECFLEENRLLYTEDTFFGIEGRISRIDDIKALILNEIKDYCSVFISRKIDSIMNLLKICSSVDDFPPEADKIHFKNGTYFVGNKEFRPDKDKIVRFRLYIEYNQNAPNPLTWLNYLNDLFYPEDIPTIQEFLGYCLIPTTKAQKALVIKGKGGEGKSQMGYVIKKLFGSYSKDGSIAKVSEDRFARADLEGILLMIDDDLKMEGLKQTDYIKKIITSQDKKDLERKGKQSYQGYIYSRIIAFSNGDLIALYDRSNGFFRRQLVITTKDRSPERVDDPFIAEKMCKELDGILVWQIEGLDRLIANNYVFTESGRTKANREAVKSNSCNAIEFMDSDGFIRFNPEGSITAKELYVIYCSWCTENAFEPMKQRSFSNFIGEHLDSYKITHDNNVYNNDNTRVWGYHGIEKYSQ